MDGFDPHITSAVSDVIKVAPLETPLTEQGLWSPGVPFASQRTADKVPGVGDQLTDRLLVYPAQFNAGGDRTGRLRRFSRMVFEITYLDPAIATQQLENLRQRPYVALTGMEIRQLEGGDTVLLSAAGDVLDVRRS